MKRLSEVCKIVGVTRRTLQEYNEIGLLTPTEKTSAGYWMYDDNAVETLMYIQIFIECGYQRKEIKQILCEEERDIFEVFDELIFKLEEKQKRIDGMINTVNVLKTATSLPLSILMAIQKVVPGNAFKEDSFRSYLEKSILNGSESDNEYANEARPYIFSWYAIVAIGCYKGIPCDSPEVTECIEILIDSILQMVVEDDEECEKADIVECLYELMEEMLADEQLGHMIELQCGDGAGSYILKSIKTYEDNFGIKEET